MGTSSNLLLSTDMGGTAWMSGCVLLQRPPTCQLPEADFLLCYEFQRILKWHVGKQLPGQDGIMTTADVLSEVGFCDWLTVVETLLLQHVTEPVALSSAGSAPHGQARQHLL